MSLFFGYICKKLQYKMALTTVDFDGKFRYDLATKQVTFTDTTDYVSQSIDPADVTIVIKAETSGGGIFYNNTNHGVPDIDPDVSLDSTIVIPLPLDGSGLPLQDDYTFTLEWQETSGVPYEVTKVKTETLSYSSPSVDISMDVDCITPRLTATDDSDYTVGGISPSIVRAFAIHYPPSVPTADVTGTGSSVYTSTFYTVADSTVEHSSSLTSTLTYNLGDGVYIIDSVTGSKVIQVSCDGDLCDIYCCIRSQWNRYQTAKGNNNDVLALSELKKFQEITSLAQMVGTALKCGKSTHISGYVSEILRISDCDAGCSCSDGTPQLVTGLGAGNSDVTVAAGTGVSVNLAGSEYTVSLSSTNVNKLASTYNSVVAAGTNVSSVSSSSVTAGDVTTTTYTVNATDTVVESMFVEVLLSFPVGTVPTYSITSQNKYGTTFQSVTDALGIAPFFDISNGGVVLDWQQNYVSITVQNFFSGGSTDYYPEVISAEEISWGRSGRGSLGSITNNGNKVILITDIYDKNASDFKIRFLNPKKMLGSDVENQLSSVKLIFKIQA
jgi:hypothetical protein